MFKLAVSYFDGILIYKPLASIPGNDTKNLFSIFFQYGYQRLTKVPGNGAKNFFPIFFRHGYQRLTKVPGNGAKTLVNQFFDRPNLFISFVLSLKYPTTKLPGNCHCFVTEFSAAGFSIFK